MCLTLKKRSGTGKLYHEYTVRHQKPTINIQAATFRLSDGGCCYYCCCYCLTKRLQLVLHSDPNWDQIYTLWLSNIVVKCDHKCDYHVTTMNYNFTSAVVVKRISHKYYATDHVTMTCNFTANFYTTSPCRKPAVKHTNGSDTTVGYYDGLSGRNGG